MPPFTILRMEEKCVSLDENYFKMHQLVNSKAPQKFRIIFTKLWQDSGHPQWENGIAFGTAFMQGAGSTQYKNSQKIQKELLRSGNVNTWDLPLLLDSIKSIHTYASIGHPHKDFENLKQIRNKLSHLGSPELSDQVFSIYWQTATQILTKFGLTTEEIEDIQKMKVASAFPTEEKSEQNQKFANITELKERGNNLFREEQYWKAIKVYSEAIVVENVSPTDLGILYSNRSAAFSSVEFYSNAKEDAKCCINLRPHWGKGYYRLGLSYEKMKKIEKALMHYKISLKYDPSYAPCLDAKNYCVHALGKLRREEHLDPLTMPPTADDLRKFNHKLGLQNVPFADEMKKRLFLAGDAHYICTEAHKYLHGNEGYQLSLEKAAGLFAKAASKGNAEGMYNLGVLTADGNGVKRDMRQALQLQLRAAGEPPLMDIFPGWKEKVRRIGVKEAQHWLGLAYENGGVVRQDYKQACEWYTKSLRNGSGFSANNLGIIYSQGKGVARDVDKALGYWKVGSLMGTVRAMESIAFHNFYYGPRSSAVEWYTYALRNNTMNQNLRQLFANETVLADFNIDKFENDLDQELLNSDMKEFVNVKDYDSDLDGLERRRSRRLKKLERAEHGGVNSKTVKIVNHRKSLKMVREMTRDTATSFKSTTQAKLFPLRSPNVIGLKAITLKEMDKSVNDKIYDGHAIQVSIVEDAVLGMTSIRLLAEDENGDLERVFVYNYPQCPDTHDEIGYGCAFTIINPYLRLMTDGEWGIGVDDPNLLIKHPQMKIVGRCRYCGEAGGTIKCRYCKRVNYCSKECRHNDSKELQHELICSKKI